MQENQTRGSRVPMPEDAGRKCGTVKSILGFVKEKILYPFRQDLIYFLLIWVVIALPSCFIQLGMGNIAYIMYLLMLYYIIAYAITVVLNLHKIVAWVFRPLFFVMASILSLLIYIVSRLLGVYFPTILFKL